MLFDIGKDYLDLSDREYIEIETIVHYCGCGDVTSYTLRYCVNTCMRITYYSKAQESLESCIDTLKRLIETYKEIDCETAQAQKAS